MATGRPKLYLMPPGPPGQRKPRPHVQPSQLVAGSMSLRDILSTVHDGSLGADVHPLVLDAVVQAVLSKSEAEPSAAPAATNSIVNPQAIHYENPYWHLTKMPLHPPEGHPYEQWAPSSYDAFWSNFERSKATESSTRTPLGATSQNTNTIPTWNAATPPFSPQPLTSGSTPHYRIPTPSPSPESQSPCNKRKAASLEEMTQVYPALADFIRVIPPSSSSSDDSRKNISPFPCNRCRQTVGGELTAMRQHLVDAHSVLDRKASTRCIFPGCDRSVFAGQIGSHIATHQARDVARCGLCGKGFAKAESVVQHIITGTCQIIQAADAAEDSQRRQKRTRQVL
ncbi:hypothetical protein LshimejAT787_1202980 [Lyophyllum shimeji]|uniref:C2H2-type domain-containing protein n=1 Tax=Lyophyllum shimeji TaxID=47721 RepID=A0A9P3UPJ7_LYOSH|nr:hypothetical protein LshimejAT787_1202980 [Lyophyllum shimeji]